MAPGTHRAWESHPHEGCPPDTKRELELPLVESFKKYGILIHLVQLKTPDRTEDIGIFDQGIPLAFYVLKSAWHLVSTMLCQIYFLWYYSLYMCMCTVQYVYIHLQIHVHVPKSFNMCQVEFYVSPGAPCYTRAARANRSRECMRWAPQFGRWPSWSWSRYGAPGHSILTRKNGLVKNWMIYNVEPPSYKLVYKPH